MHGVGAPTLAGWARSLEFAGRCVIASAIVVVLLFTLRPIMAEVGRLQIAGRIGLVLLVLIQVAVCALIVTGGNRLIHDVATIGLTAMALVLLLVGQPAGPWEPTWWPTSAVHTVQLYVLAFGRRHRWALGGAAVALFAGLRLVATVRSGDPLVLGMVEVVVGIQLSLTVVLAVRAGRRIAARHDGMEAERAEAMAVRGVREQQERRGREINRFLHDEVIHSLRAIALPRQRVPASQVRARAARTVARLRPGPDTGSPAGAEDDIGVRLGRTAAELGLRAAIEGRLVRIADDVGRALELAGAEVLRNTARHAGTDRVRIQLTARRGRCTVLITDDGCGFDATRLGSGLRDSVTGRMAEVGGQAAIDSGRGGTAVALSWAPAPAQERIGRVWADLTRALTPMVWPGIGGLLLTSVLLLPEIANAALMLTGLVVVTAVAVLALRWPGRRLPPVALPLLLFAAVVGVLTNYLAVPPETSNGYHLLMAGGVTSLLILIVIHFSTRWAVIGALVMWGTVLGGGAWRFGLDAMMGPLSGASTGPVLGLALIPLKLVLRRVAERTLAVQDATLRSQLSSTDPVRRSSDDRVRRTRERVLPFLEAVADNTLEPGDPATTSRALALEGAVREELRWPGAPGAVLRAAGRARGRGWQIELRLTEEQVAASADAVVHLLDALGQPVGCGSVVLSAFGGLAAVVQSPSPAAVQRWRDRDDLSVEEVEEWCRLKVRKPLALEVPARRDSPERDGPRRLPV